VTNFSGAAGDLWMVGQIWRFRHCRDLSLADSATSLEVYSSDPAAPAVAAALTARLESGVLRRILARWLFASSLILMAAIPASILLAVLKSDDVTIGPRQFAIATYDALPDGGQSMSLNVNAVVVAGLLCALLSLIVVRPAKRRVADEPPSAGSPHPALL
jgi:hypothetical protein